MKKDFYKVMVCAACVVGMGINESEASRASRLFAGMESLAAKRSVEMAKEQQSVAMKDSDGQSRVSMDPSDKLKSDSDLGKACIDSIGMISSTMSAAEIIIKNRKWGLIGGTRLADNITDIHDSVDAIIAAIGTAYGPGLANVAENDAYYLIRLLYAMYSVDAATLKGHTGFANDGNNDAALGKIRDYYTALEGEQTRLRTALNNGTVAEHLRKYEDLLAKFRRDKNSLSTEETEFVTKVEKVAGHIEALLLK